MKILIVVHYFAPHIGGMEEVARKQATSLVGAGHDVTILTCRPNGKAPLQEIKHGYTIKRIRALNAIENKFGVTFPLISPFIFLNILKAVRAADVVHIHDVFYMSSHMAGIIAILTRKPIYLTQHVAMVDHPSALVMMIQRIIYATFGRLLFMMARRIICYNTNVRDFLVRKNVPEKKILLHYNGIEIEYFSPASERKRAQLKQQYGLNHKLPVVLFVGRLVPKKGYDIIFNARSSNYQMMIVGTGEVPAQMRAASDVQFFGGATQAQLRDLYQLSDVFVFPAIGEILTLVMQEAMATGLPIITTDDPAYKGYDIDTRYIKLVSRDSTAFANAIEEVLADPALQTKMGRYSRQLAVERFSWDKNFHEELAVYTEEKQR